MKMFGMGMGPQMADDEFIDDLHTDNHIAGSKNPAGNIGLIRVCPGIGIDDDIAVQKNRSTWHWLLPDQR